MIQLPRAADIDDACPAGFLLQEHGAASTYPKATYPRLTGMRAKVKSKAG